MNLILEPIAFQKMPFSRHLSDLYVSTRVHPKIKSISAFVSMCVCPAGWPLYPAALLCLCTSVSSLSLAVL